MSLENALQKIERERVKKTGHLDLSHQRLKEIPKELLVLKHLKRLTLSGNYIVDISQLVSLDKLQELHLNSNKILDISVLSELKNLQILNLYANKITDISVLINLNKLVNLYIGFNRITDIPELTYHDELRYLNFTNNLITNLRPILPLVKILRSSLRINFDNNPLIHPSLEIVKQGNEAIIKYFEDLEKQGADELYEAKLLIVGEGESGKTTLARKLKDRNAPMPDKETERTEGIDVAPIHIPNQVQDKKDFQMNVWDFGGQEIYHATHQFFLTKRSLYIIVNNTRSNLTDFNEWLQKISLLTDNSPVIIVQNQVAGSPTDLDLRGLQANFSNILGVYDVDLSNTECGRFEKLEKAVQFHIQQLDHVGSVLPKQWVVIREKLNEIEKTKPYISDKEFRQICKDNKITEREAMKRLSSFFHDLGVFLHFQDDAVLRRLVILKNDWATKGVYKILDDKNIQKNKGHFSYEEIEALYENTPFDDMHSELLSLMDKFELCYQIPDIKEQRYVSPQLLSKEKPIYEWDNHENLVIYYDYDFMPKGLLSRLMVRLYRYIKNIDHMAWRMGCVFTYESTDAQVIETYGNKKIEIRIKGKHTVRLATIITSEIDALNATFENIKVSKMIPCNCRECTVDKEPHFYKYENLMTRKAKGKKRTIECVKSEEDVNYLKLLDGIFEKNFNKYLIQDLIKKGKTEQALEELEKVSRDEAILLSARYIESKKKYHAGTLAEANWQLIINKTNQSIMDSFQNSYR